MPKPYDTSLPPDLRALKEEIEHHARSYGLDFYETIFEVVDADDLNEIASYGGFPTRYPHWSFGMAYEELKKSYDYGLSKIYEMVINNDPCYAYLMRCNHTVDQKLVMAHVYGHCLAPETKVETREGSELITDVKVGDEVLTHTGRYRRVRAVARRWYSGEICRLKIEGRDEVIRVTPEHPVFVLRPAQPTSALVTSFRAIAEPWQLEPWAIGTGWDPDSLAEELWIPAGEIVAGEMTLIPVDYKNWFPPGEHDESTFTQIGSAAREQYEGYVYNFSVDEDESYVLSVGMTVHNCDFFKNNAYFGHTSRKMMDEMANHGARVRRYAEKHGEDEVEHFVDRCMSIDDLIDIHSVAIKRREEVSRYDFSPEPDGSDEMRATRFKSKAYMDDYINPRDVLRAEEEERKKLKEQTARNFPERPEKDVLLFLIENAPLKGWQRDVLSIVRDEAYYFAPQAMTKVLNEGWASFWHSTIMTERALTPWECVDYADHHSGTMATYGGRINPYKLGIELLRHVEHRWDTGKFGKDYDDCDDLEKRRAWDKKLGLGRKKIFEVRRVHNDITFIDTFLTPEFCVEHKLFSYAFQEQAGQYFIESRDFQKIKQRLLFSLTNFGKPWIYVVDGNYRNRGELLLRHEHNGVDLKLNQAADTLANLQFMWSRPVHLQTTVDGKPTTLSFDGSEHSIRSGGESDDGKRSSSAKSK